jgi:hypothetical protein
MADRYDEESLYRDWDQMEQPDRACAEGLRFCDGVLHGEIDPVANLDLYAKLLEPAWDGPTANFTLAYESLLRSESAFETATHDPRLDTATRIRLLGRTQTLLAKGAHRLPKSRQAFVTSLSLIKFLEGIAGGREALRDVIGRSTPNALAEATVEGLGVFIASMRALEGGPERQLDPRVREDLYAIGYELLRAYLGPGHKPRVLYPGSHSTGTQWFYRLARDPEAPDRLVLACFELDKRSRPATARSGGTAHSREAEFATRFGETERAEREKRLTLEAMETHGMFRHLEKLRTHFAL